MSSVIRITTVLQTIAVTFSKLSLEAHDTCVYDSVTLYDGSSTSSAQLGKFCTEASSAISSTGSSVLVFFQTDEVVNTGRFSLTWTFIGGLFTSMHIIYIVMKT